VPVFMPALITAAVALLLSRKDAPPLAYIAGGLGTLIGTDLTNLDKVRGSARPSPRSAAPERSTASFLLVSSRCCLRAFTRHALHIKHRSRAKPYNTFTEVGAAP
jgi:Protein of unknown function (DUF1614)